MKYQYKPLRPHRGAALVSALIILIVVLIIGVTGVHVTAKEIKMARNLQDEVVAFQSAESIVEQTIDKNTKLRDAVNTPCAPINNAVTGVNGANSSVAYQGEITRAGFSDDMFDSHVLQLTGTGFPQDSGNSNSRAVVVQVISWIAPPSQSFGMAEKSTNCS